MISKFPPSIHSHLNYYVYVYIDPRTNEIFYVGKGKGDRCFSHLNEVSETRKVKRIAEIRAAGMEPLIEIIIHGIVDSETAQRIEASIIDCIGMHNLTNIQHGYHSKQFGRMNIDQLISTYQAKPAKVTHPVLAFRINKTFRYGMPATELYDNTRHSWKLSNRKNRAKYAFAVYRGLVQEVYEIHQWLPQNTTPNVKHVDPSIDQTINTERWEFIGQIAPTEVRNQYLYTDVSGFFKNFAQEKAFINC